MSVHAVRNPKELHINHAYQVQLAEGSTQIELSKIELDIWKAEFCLLDG